MDILPAQTLKQFKPQLLHSGSFLNYLNLNDLSELIEYLKISFPTISNMLKANLKYKFVFHGSSDFQEQLVPRISDGGVNHNKSKPLVYATVIPDYAIFMACIKQLQKSSATVSKQGQYTISELAVNQNFWDLRNSIKIVYQD